MSARQPTWRFLTPAGADGPEPAYHVSASCGPAAQLGVRRYKRRHDMEDEIVGLVLAVLLIVPTWKIFAKAGFNPAWSLFLFLPWLGMLIVVLFLAFRRWPAVEASE